MIVGTRPEAIKLAPVILQLRQDSRLRCHVCVTGQHREMLAQALDAFEIVPDSDLDLMQAGQTLAGFASRSIKALDEYLETEAPDLVVAQGDTTTVFCAALSAFYRHIPFGHVEAGLRTGNLMAPWPEEANRVLTTRLTTLHFAPTTWAKGNLLREGVSEDRVYITGNTVVDAILHAVKKLGDESVRARFLPPSLALLTDTPYVLITGHRRESFGPGFEAICRAIARLAALRPDMHFIYPVHLNPRVQEPVRRSLGTGHLKNVHLLEPLSYLPFVELMRRCILILTDSGGIQEEAPSLGKPVLVMRDATERPEGVAAGAVRLVGTDEERIVAETLRLLDDREAYERMAHVQNPYGDGAAARRIVDVCARACLALPAVEHETAP